MTAATKRKTRHNQPKFSKFSKADWSAIYDALMDAANAYHSGPRADRTVELARKIREAALS